MSLMGARTSLSTCVTPGPVTWPGLSPDCKPPPSEPWPGWDSIGLIVCRNCIDGCCTGDVTVLVLVPFCMVAYDSAGTQTLAAMMVLNSVLRMAALLAATGGRIVRSTANEVRRATQRRQRQGGGRAPPPGGPPAAGARSPPP